MKRQWSDFCLSWEIEAKYDFKHTNEIKLIITMCIGYVVTNAVLQNMTLYST